MRQLAAFVEIIAHEHRFTATVYVHDQRLLDLLNDQTTDVLPINDVAVYRCSALEDAVAILPEAIIHKADLHLVIITREERNQPTQRLFGYVQKMRYPVFLTVPGYDVQGAMHLLPSHDLDPTTILVNKASTFFPVTNATISEAWRGEEDFAVPVVMVNKRSLTLFSLGEAPMKT